MALPTLADKIDAVEDKIEKENIISSIATAVFKSAKITTEAAAKFAIGPSVPQMVDDVLEDLKSGSIEKFNKAMDKLDKLVKVLGIDLKKYNKELANFAEKREEKIIQSEEKIQTLRENNIIADITKAGDVKVLSQKEIEGKQKDLRDTEKRIKDLENKIAKDTKQVQDPGLFDKKLNTTAQFNKKEEIKRDTEELEQKKKERDESKQVLGNRGDEQPGIFQRASEGAGNFADEYIPDQIRDVAGAFTEGLTAPFTAIKELGQGFAQMLKPLKLLRPLFGGLIKSLKLFAAGLKASVVAMLPYLAIAGLVVLALGGLYFMLKKAADFFGKDDKTGLEDYGEDIGGTDVAEEGDMSSKKQRRSFVVNQGTENAEIIQPDDPRYDEMYEAKYGKPAPASGQVYNSETGETEILPLTSDGQIIKSGNLMDEKNRNNLQVPTGLKPVDGTSGGNNTVVDNKQTAITTNNNTYNGSGLNGAKNNDIESFAMAHKMASA